MFILAFENSCCEEYISEKFWKVLSTGVSIPVVIGAKKEDYKRLGPPNSFIHVDDFNSMQELASYLQKVANNSVTYNSFFKWKKFGTVSQTGFHDRRIVYNKSACLLMDFLKNGVLEKKETFDLYGSSWLGGCKGCSSKAWIAKYGIHQESGLPLTEGWPYVIEESRPNHVTDHARSCLSRVCTKIIILNIENHNYNSGLEASSRRSITYYIGTEVPKL
ncbi:hypothetical protein BSL78_20684 [Apostichopus japonicus]|uniref:Fucosyltransferase n=1 Tax=Stichopus japonicus TaxID=307972 RepID=A0A2G8K3C0_STIJA|nr:hypothetical protein BSL78_20684 [Apostichopus japonicus]